METRAPSTLKLSAGYSVSLCWHEWTHHRSDQSVFSIRVCFIVWRDYNQLSYKSITVWRLGALGGNQGEHWEGISECFPRTVDPTDNNLCRLYKHHSMADLEKDWGLGTIAASSFGMGGGCAAIMVGDEWGYWPTLAKSNLLWERSDTLCHQGPSSWFTHH